jgi:rhamnogalacturonyl hydrolase YesR
LDLLEHVPAADKRRGELVSALVDLAEALRQLQRSDGGWYAVVDDPTSGDETSTAAFAAAGFARGVLNGLLDARFRPAAIRAWEYTLAHLDNRGVLQGISAAVWPCTNQSHYSHLSRRENVPWGQGPLLVAAKHIAVLSAQRQGADQ